MQRLTGIVCLQMLKSKRRGSLPALLDRLAIKCQAKSQKNAMRLATLKPDAASSSGRGA